MSCPKADLHHTVSRLHGWTDRGALFMTALQQLTTAQKVTNQFDPQKKKEANWADYNKQLLSKLESVR